MGCMGHNIRHRTKAKMKDERLLIVFGANTTWGNSNDFREFLQEQIGVWEDVL
jgi:hypothetical protein